MARIILNLCFITVFLASGCGGKVSYKPDQSIGRSDKSKKIDYENTIAKSKYALIYKETYEKTPQDIQFESISELSAFINNCGKKSTKSIDNKILPKVLTEYAEKSLYELPIIQKINTVAWEVQSNNGFYCPKIVGDFVVVGEETINGDKIYHDTIENYVDFKVVATKRISGFEYASGKKLWTIENLCFIRSIEDISGFAYLQTDKGDFVLDPSTGKKLYDVADGSIHKTWNGECFIEYDHQNFSHFDIRTGKTTDRGKPFPVRKTDTNLTIEFMPQCTVVKDGNPKFWVHPMWNMHDDFGHEEKNRFFLERIQKTQTLNDIALIQYGMPNGEVRTSYLAVYNEPDTKLLWQYPAMPMEFTDTMDLVMKNKNTYIIFDSANGIVKKFEELNNKHIVEGQARKLDFVESIETNDNPSNKNHWELFLDDADMKPELSRYVGVYYGYYNKNMRLSRLVCFE